MRADATRYGSVAVCACCAARFAAATREQALRLLDQHETLSSCRTRLMAAR